MTITNRRYNDEFGFAQEYHRVWEFLIRLNKDKVVDEGFLWGRWEWGFCLKRYFDTNNLHRIVSMAEEFDLKKV